MGRRSESPALSTSGRSGELSPPASSLPRQHRLPKLARLILSVLLAALLLGVLLHWSGRQAWQALQMPVPLWAWATLAFGLCGSYVFRALRVHAEWRETAGVGFTECLSVSLLHNAAVNLLPLRGGELAFPWLLHKRWGVSVARAGASLLCMRVQDAAVLALFACLLWAPFGLAVRVALAALGLLLVLAALPPLLQSWAAQAARRPAGVLRHLIDALRAARGRRSGWVYSAANWALKLLVVGVMLSALGDLPASGALSGALGGELAAVLPLQGPAGLGTYEAGVVAGAHLGGAATAQLVGAALLVHACSWLIALAAAALALLWRAVLGRPLAAQLQGFSR